MRNPKPLLLHFGQDGRGRRRARGHDVDRVRDWGSLGLRGVDQHVKHHGRAAEMRHSMATNCIVDVGCRDMTETDVGARLRGDPPREAPAVAVEQGKRPQVDGADWNLPHEQGAESGNVGTSVGEEHAFGAGSRAGSVSQRDRVPLLGRRCPFEPRIALGEKIFVFNRASFHSRRESAVLGAIQGA